MADKILAIVIRSSDKKEKDKNILLFSIEHGKEWATLRGVKSQNAKMKIAQNLFCFGEFLLESGKSGQVVTNFSSVETFHELSESVDKYFEATALLEVVNGLEFSSETERKMVFVLLLKMLKKLCFENIEELLVLDKFLIEIFKIYGFPIMINGQCSCCSAKLADNLFFDYVTGQIVCGNCKGFNSDALLKATYSAIKILSNCDIEKISTIKLAKDSAFSLLKILTKNFAARFEKNLKFVGILS